MKQFEDLDIEELQRLGKGEVTEYIREDFAEGVALINAVMKQVKQKSGYKDGLKWAQNLWQKKLVKAGVWGLQTLLLIAFFSTPWVWITGLALGFVLAYLSSIHEWRVRNVCMKVRNHFEALDNVRIDIDTLKQFYYGQVPAQL